RRGGEEKEGKGQCGTTRYHHWPSLSRQAYYLKPAS
ncbi:unnamed protein product, partial [Ectocarpus sp. 6 AP-2014]